MQGVAILLLLLCFVFLILGLIKPSFVIRWGKEEHKTRKAVLGVFFFAFVFAVIVGAVAQPDVKSVNETVAVNNKTENSNSKDIAKLATEDENIAKELEEFSKNNVNITEVIKNADGSVNYKIKGGSMYTVYPDGTKSLFNESGEKFITKYADGSSVEPRSFL